MHSHGRALAAALLASFLILPACGGGDDAPLLTRSEAEPAGAHCAHGGQAVRVGHDDDGDGQLADGEVEGTEYVCAAEHALLVRSDVEPAGAYCASGGIAVRSGIDDDGDGQLGDAEVDQTTYVCGQTEIWAGDFNAWDDPIQVAQLQEARVVTGSLVIPTDVAVTLPQLEIVGGTLSLTGPGTGPVELPALRQVGGLSTNEALVAPALTDVGGDLGYHGQAEKGFLLPALVRIGGDLVTTSASGQIGFAALETIGGSLHLVACDGLRALHFPALTRIGGELSSVLTHLDRLDLPALVHVGGELSLSHDDRMDAVLLPALEEATGTLSLSSLPKVETVALGHLARPTALTVFGLPVLHALDLSRLGGGSVAIDAVGLTDLALPAFAVEGSDLGVSHCASLRTLDLPLLDRVHTLYVMQNPRLESITAESMEVANFIELEDLPALTQFNMHSLGNVSSLNMVRVGLTEAPELPVLRTASFLGFQDMAGLTSLSGLAALTTVGELDLHLDPALLDLRGLEGLTYVRDVLDISGAGLTSLHGLEQLEHAGNLRVYFTPITDLAALSGLRSISGNLILDEDGSLTA